MIQSPSSADVLRVEADVDIVWRRFVFTRLAWQARQPCGHCRPSMPCEVSQHTSLLADATSIALDLANAERHRVTGGPHPTLTTQPQPKDGAS